MDWPALLEALRPFGFSESGVFQFTAHRDRDTERVVWEPPGARVEVWRSMVNADPPLFSGSPEEVVRWFEQRERGRRHD